MEQLVYYNNEIDKILFDVIGSDSFMEEDLDELVNVVTQTIGFYDKKQPKSNIKKIVYLIINAKYKKCYTYDCHANINRCGKKTSLESKSKSKSNTLSIKQNYINSELIKPRCRFLFMLWNIFQMRNNISTRYKRIMFKFIPIIIMHMIN